MSTRSADLRDINGKPVPNQAFDADGSGIKYAHYPTNWPLLAMLFFLPLQNLQVGYMPILPGGLNFLNVAFGLSLIGMSAVRGKLASYQGLNGWVVAYILWGAVTWLFGYTTVGDNADNHFNAYKDQVIGILIFFVVQKSVRDWVGFRRIVLATLLPLAYMARIVRAQNSTVSSWHYNDDLRISGTFTLLGANEMAAHAVMVLCLCLGLLFVLKRDRIMWPVIFVGLLAAGVSIMYGYSRTSYVAVMCGAAAVYLFNHKKGAMLIPMLLALTITVSVMPQSVLDRFDMLKGDAAETDNSTQSRYVFWGIGIERWKTSPVLGIGYHTFHHPEHNPYLKDTHNYYVLMLVERGIVGAIIFFVMLTKMWKATRSLGKRRGLPRWVSGFALGMTGVLVGMMIGNTFGDRFSHYPMMGCFWAWMALIVKIPDLLRETEGAAQNEASGAKAVAVR